jgi:hypothetical protein
VAPITLIEADGQLSPTPRIHYIDFPFTVPDSASKVHAVFRFHKEQLAQLFISLHDPNGFRGNRMNPGAKGAVELELWVTPDDASEGAVPGSIPAGDWRLQLDIEALGEDVEYQLTIYAEQDTVPQAVVLDFPETVVINDESGWYKGELHAHSTESDGKHTVETVIEAAIDSELDFFALTDHFTNSQWRKLAPYHKHIALLHSIEITSHHGHANVHGLRDWVDVFVDREDWSMSDAAAATHAQGGLFCVNHPFSGRLGWQAYDFDWDQADMMEIYHHLEGPNNPYQVALWDRHLAAGRRLVGVGGIDSHDPFTGRHKLGQAVTWVYADELSERGVIEGIKRGRVYVSRGPQVRFTASDNDNTAHMWETLHTSDDLKLCVEVLTEETVRCFVFRDGYNYESVIVEPSTEWQSLTFDATAAHPSYYRVELHSAPDDGEFRFLQRRDYDTVRVLTNPIWVQSASSSSVSIRNKS